MKLLYRTIFLLLFSFLFVHILGQAQDIKLFTDYGANESAGNYMIDAEKSIYYEVYGEGYPLLLLHGNHASIAWMKGQIEGLSQYFKIIVVDNRHHGRSVALDTTLTYEIMAHDMLQLLDELKIEKTDVLGWSDGANIALQMSIIAPDKIRNAVLLSCNYKIDSTVVDKQVLEDLDDKIKSTKYPIERNIFKLCRYYPNINEDVLINNGVRTLILNAENDIITNTHAEELHANLFNSELFIIPDSDHFVLIENPEIVNALVLNFLQSENSKIKISGYVRDEDGVPVHYANIGVVNTPIGTVSLDSGQFSLEIPKYQYVFDSLSCSCIGYDSFLKNVCDLVDDDTLEIVLKEKSYRLDEILVFSKAIKTKKIGVRSPAKIIKGVLHGLEKAYLIEAKKYPIKINTLNFAVNNKDGDSITFRINYYLDADSIPGKLINTEQIIVKNALVNDSWISVDLSPYNHTFQDDFFVAVELLPNANGNRINTRFLAKMNGQSKTFTRNYLDNWEKLTGISAVINVMVQYE